MQYNNTIFPSYRACSDQEPYLSYIPLSAYVPEYPLFPPVFDTQPLISPTEQYNYYKNLFSNIDPNDYSNQKLFLSLNNIFR